MRTRELCSRAAVFGALLLGGVLATSQTGAQAAEPPVYDGWLCCTMRTSGDWISDINYAGNGMRLVPAGTPVSIAGHGRYMVNVRIDGRDDRLGNDYSRDLTPTEFTERYIVRQDPSARLASWPESVRRAIATARIQKGMTREQVIMALGYPVTSENPHLDATQWRYWLSSFTEFTVHFNGAGKVSKVTGDEDALPRVLMP